jgi:tetratricopeptide (TPR) repeat protein
LLEPKKQGSHEMKHFIYCLLSLIVIASASATPWREIKRGNLAADSGDADQAHYHYLKALEQGGDTNVIEYDVGNLLYKLNEYDKAQQAYMASLDTTQSLKEQSDALYNLANSYYNAEQYEPAVKAYELALRMMQQQQQQQQQQDQEKNEDQQQDEQQQDQQQQDQDQEQEQKQDEQQQQQQQEQEQQKQDEQKKQQQQPQEMSKEEAEQLLNALMQDEQNALEQVKKAKAEGRKKRERDW